MFPFLLLVALAAQAMGVLNACGRFGVPALASTFFNVGSVPSGWPLGFTAGPVVRAGPDRMRWRSAWWSGGLLQLALAGAQPVAAGFRASGRASTGAIPACSRISRLMGPAILGNAAVQINVMVNTNFASGITDAAGHVINGPVSWLGYAFRFMQLPLGCSAWPSPRRRCPPSRAAPRRGGWTSFGATLARSLGMVLLLTIPSSVGLAVLGESMIGGRLPVADGSRPSIRTRPRWRSPGYSVGLAGYSVDQDCWRRRSTRSKDARTPMLVSLASIAFNLGLALALVKRAGMGHAGLALSTSLVALVGARGALLAAAASGPWTARTAPGIAALCRSRRLRRSMGAACWARQPRRSAALRLREACPVGGCGGLDPLGVAVFYAVRVGPPGSRTGGRPDRMLHCD